MNNHVGRAANFHRRSLNSCVILPEVREVDHQHLRCKRCAESPCELNCSNSGRAKPERRLRAACTTGKPMTLFGRPQGLGGSKLKVIPHTAPVLQDVHTADLEGRSADAERDSATGRSTRSPRKCCYAALNVQVADCNQFVEDSLPPPDDKFGSIFTENFSLEREAVLGSEGSHAFSVALLHGAPKDTKASRSFTTLTLGSEECPNTRNDTRKGQTASQCPGNATTDCQGSTRPLEQKARRCWGVRKLLSLVKVS